MLVTALCTACFSRAKITKKLWPSYFKICSPSPLFWMLWRRHWILYSHLMSLKSNDFIWINLFIHKEASRLVMIARYCHLAENILKYTAITYTAIMNGEI